MTTAEGTLAQLDAEKERLTLVKENASLRAEIKAAESPWWRKGTVVTTITAILAAIVPATSAIQGHFEKTRELDLEATKQANAIALEKQKQAEDIRTGYLDRMKTPGEHLRTLRFILATTTDDSLRAWATEEKRIVEDELKTLIAKVDAQAVAAAAAESAYLAALSQGPTLPIGVRSTGSAKPTIEALRARATAQQETLNDLAKKMDEDDVGAEGMKRHGPKPK